MTSGLVQRLHDAAILDAAFLVLPRRAAEEAALTHLPWEGPVGRLIAIPALSAAAQRKGDLPPALQRCPTPPRHIPLRCGRRPSSDHRAWRHLISVPS